MKIRLKYISLLLVAIFSLAALNVSAQNNQIIKIRPQGGSSGSSTAPSARPGLRATPTKPTKPAKPTKSAPAKPSKPMKPSLAEFADGVKVRWDADNACISFLTGDDKKTYSFKEVPGGWFMMGEAQEDYSDNAEGASESNPLHKVNLTTYYMGESEVPQWLWEAVMGTNPCDLKDPYLPVQNVSWNDCMSFITKLNRLTKLVFALPTEAQWEYAAREANPECECRYSGGNIVDEVAWIESNSEDRPHQVCGKKPNALGLYDMSGNVSEWCADKYGSYDSDEVTNPTGAVDGEYHVYRGGGWSDFAGEAIVSLRSYDKPDKKSSKIGLRLAIEKIPVIEKLEWNPETNTITKGDKSYQMVVVPAGTFTLGALETETDATPRERPSREVSISEYMIGATEVPQWLWESVMGYNPSTFKGEDLPVTDIDWNTAKEFTQRLNALLGVTQFHLPTEAQWEFAARGGSQERMKYAGGDDLAEVAWYQGNCGEDGPHPVAKKAPNQLGLYDMTGNVWEWTSDSYKPYAPLGSDDPVSLSADDNADRVERGGSWRSIPGSCRLTFRYGDKPDFKADDMGLRLAWQ